MWYNRVDSIFEGKTRIRFVVYFVLNDSMSLCVLGNILSKSSNSFKVYW